MLKLFRTPPLQRTYNLCSFDALNPIIPQSHLSLSHRNPSPHTPHLTTPPQMSIHMPGTNPFPPVQSLYPLDMTRPGNFHCQICKTYPNMKACLNCLALAPNGHPTSYIPPYSLLLKELYLPPFTAEPVLILLSPSGPSYRQTTK